MSNPIDSFKHQTVYFKTMLIVTIVPILLTAVYLVTAIMEDQSQVRSHTPDAGLATLMYGVILIIIALVYPLLLFLSSRKSVVGIIFSSATIAATFFIYVVLVAGATSGASK